MLFAMAHLVALAQAPPFRFPPGSFMLNSSHPLQGLGQTIIGLVGNKHSTFVGAGPVLAAQILNNISAKLGLPPAVSIQPGHARKLSVDHFDIPCEKIGCDGDTKCGEAGQGGNRDAEQCAAR